MFACDESSSFQEGLENLTYVIEDVRKEGRLTLPLIRTEETFMVYSTNKAATSYFEVALILCSPSLWNNLPLSVCSATSVATFKKYLKTPLFDLAFPHIYRHSPWPVDVIELFPRF